MENALQDFMHHCRIERRLAPLTCSAYERDVTACMGFLQAAGASGWASVCPADLRRLVPRLVVQLGRDLSSSRCRVTMKEGPR
jgi:site-specific recombinase XerD